MALKFRSPFSTKEDPDQIIRKIDRLQNRLQKAYTAPQVISLTDNELFQVIAGAMGWQGIQKVTETQTINGQILAYCYCPVVTSVVNKKNDLLRSGHWSLQDKDGNEVTKGTQNFLKLYKHPNPLQNWTRFISMAYSMHQIFGRCYILPVVPATYKTKDAAAIWIIPNWMVRPNYTNRLFQQTELTEIITDYTITGINRNILPSELIVWEDTTVSLLGAQQYRIESQSRLFSLTDAIVNFQTSFAARRTLLEKRGALGAWVNNNPKDASGANTIVPKERDKILNEFGGPSGTYGIDRGKFPWILTTSFLKWEQAGFATKDLMLFEEGKDSGVVIYDAYGLSVFLSPWADQTTYTNLEKAEKRAYTGTIIPDAEGLCKLLNQAFELEAEGLELNIYFDHLECFQKANKDEAVALYYLMQSLDIPYKGRVITREEFRALISDYMPQGSGFDATNIAGSTYFIQPGTAPPPPEPQKEIKGHNAMVKCAGCGFIFAYDAEPEAGTGYVKCPSCGKFVNQSGNLVA